MASLARLGLPDIIPEEIGFQSHTSAGGQIATGYFTRPREHLSRSRYRFPTGSAAAGHPCPAHHRRGSTGTVGRGPARRNLLRPQSLPGHQKIDSRHCGELDAGLHALGAGSQIVDGDARGKKESNAFAESPVPQRKSAPGPAGHYLDSRRAAPPLACPSTATAHW